MYLYKRCVIRDISAQYRQQVQPHLVVSVGNGEYIVNLLSLSNRVVFPYNNIVHLNKKVQQVFKYIVDSILLFGGL